MKKHIFLTVLMTFFFLDTDAQYFNNIKMGFRFAPMVVANQVEGTKRFKDFTSNGLDVRTSIGPFADVYFGEKYAFSTGLFYSVKSVHYAVKSGFYSDSLFRTNPITKDEIKGGIADFNLQYLQIPISLKLFSGEIARQSIMYIQFGGTLDVKISEKSINTPRNALVQFQDRLPIEQNIFSVADANMLVGVGVEHKIGFSDAIFASFQYQRGLSDINRNNVFRDLSTKNGVFMLEMGLKF